MTLIVRTQSEINRRVEDVFNSLIDYSQWPRFMPSCFRGVLGPSRPLREGDRVLLMMAAVGPGLMRVQRLRPAAEICWGGGIPKVIVAEHRFFFDALGDARTQVRSEERFDGALLRFDSLRQMAEREALIISEQILAGLKAFVEHRP